jgi:hypothetical protein
MENREVARILRETAQLLEIDGAMIGRYPQLRARRANSWAACPNRSKSWPRTAPS